MPWRRTIALPIVAFAACVAPAPGPPHKGTRPLECQTENLTRPPVADPSAPRSERARQLTLAAQQIRYGYDLPPEGYDIDGEWTEPGRPLVPRDCNACEGHPSRDLAGGADNAWFNAAGPMWSWLDPQVPRPFDRAVAAGRGTPLIVQLELGPELAQNGVVGRVFAGADRGAPPSWDGSDVWPVAGRSVADGDIRFPIVEFDDSYVVDGTYVTRRLRVPIELALQTDRSVLMLTVHVPQLSINLEPLLVGENAAVDGFLTGVLLPQELAPAGVRFLAAYSDWFCTEQGRNYAAEDVDFSRDILADGTQTPDRECEAISFGMGFTFRPVVLGPVVPEAALPDPCETYRPRDPGCCAEANPGFAAAGASGS